MLNNFQISNFRLKNLRNFFVKYKRVLIVSGILCLIIFWLLTETIRILIIRSQDIMSVAFLDVGQGDALLITTPNQKQIMIDTSAGDTVIGGLAEEMHYFDRTIDLIITTHAHLDHYGGLSHIVGKYDLRSHVLNYGNDTAQGIVSLERILQAKQVDQIILQAGDRIVLDQKRNIYIDIYWPTEHIPISDKNDSSIVAHLVFDEISFLMTGDAGIKIENYLVEEFGDRLKANVLKLGHHGSRTSTGPTFLQTVQPEFAVISAGHDNQYGHPHQEVFDNLKSYQQDYAPAISENWIQTTQKGTVSFKTNGRTVWLD